VPFSDRPLQKECLALPSKSLVGAAAHATALHRWRGGVRAYPHAQHTKEEGAHQIQDPSDPWQCAGGGAAPEPTLGRSIRRRRGLIGSEIPPTHGSAQEEGQRPTMPPSGVGGEAAPLIKCTPPCVRRR
jgi:hypothetical protein